MLIPVSKPALIIATAAVLTCSLWQSCVSRSANAPRHQRASSQETLSFAHWMASAPIEDVPLNRVAIPGSHDSASYAISAQSPVCDGWGMKVKFSVAPAKSYILARTQHLTIGEQLRAGSRYFDIRLCEVKGVVYTHHGGVASAPFAEVITDLTSYLADPNYGSEVVIFHIQQSSAAPSKVSVFLEPLQPYMAGDHLTPTSTIAAFRAASTRLIVIGKHWGWQPANTLANPFANSSNTTRTLRYVAKYLAHRDMSKLHVAQCIAGNLPVAAAKFRTTRLDPIAAAFNNAALHWLESSAPVAQLNIIMIDMFAATDPLVPFVTNLNNTHTSLMNP